MLHVFSINLVKVKKFDLHASHNILLSGTEGVDYREKGRLYTVSNRVSLRYTNLLINLLFQLLNRCLLKQIDSKPFKPKYTKAEFIPQ